MAEYQVIQDTVLSGTNTVGVGASAEVTIKSAVTGELVSLYQDRLGASGETNPFNADASGQFRVYAAPGRLQITVVYNSVTRVWEDFRLGEPALEAGRRLNLSGEMCIAQEGTSFAGVGAAGGTEFDLDGWWCYTAGTPQARVTVTQESGSSGFRNWRKVDCTTAEAAVAAGEVFLSGTSMEGRGLQHLEYGAATANTIVIRLRIKSPKTGTVCIFAYQPDAGRSFIREITIAAADTEEEHTVTIPGDASGTINNDSGEGLRVGIAHVCGSTFQTAADAWTAGEYYATSNQQNLLDSTDNNLEITAFQVEVGGEATEFEHKDYENDLADALWFYERFAYGNGGDVCVMQCLTATTARGALKWTQKRIAPAVTASAAADFDLHQTAGTDSPVTSLSFNAIRTDGCNVNPTASGGGLTAGNATWMDGDTGGSAAIYVDARLGP